MARITVEDCLEKIPNRFQLVLAATYRARMLSQGHAPKIESKNKPGVTACAKWRTAKSAWKCSKRSRADAWMTAPRRRRHPKSTAWRCFLVWRATFGV